MTMLRAMIVTAALAAISAPAFADRCPPGSKWQRYGSGGRCEPVHVQDEMDQSSLQPRLTLGKRQGTAATRSTGTQTAGPSRPDPAASQGGKTLRWFNEAETQAGRPPLNRASGEKPGGGNLSAEISGDTKSSARNLPSQTGGAERKSGGNLSGQKSQKSSADIRRSRAADPPPERPSGY